MDKAVICAVDASEELDLRRRIGLVEGEVEVDAQLEDGDRAGEVGGQEVRLWPVRLPEGGWDWVEQGGRAAVRFVRADCPGGEG